MSLSVTIDDTKDITQNILNDWDLQTHGIDIEVLNDIKSAIFEAYQVGCVHGVLDNHKFIQALKFLKD